MTSQTGWGYVALCLIAPLAWGVLSARVFEGLEKRRARKNHATVTDEGESGEMYHI